MISEFKKLVIPGVYEIIPDIKKDLRGQFVKIFHQDTFLNYGLETNFPEEYYTISKKRVLRGLHLQLPPADHVKIVTCLEGRVYDVVIDLRFGSPTFKKYFAIELTDEKRNMIYIPKGIAHGFYTYSDKAILFYRQSSMYSPKHDTGILWNSVGIPWPDISPILSGRDKSFKPIANFKTPFVFKGNFLKYYLP